MYKNLLCVSLVFFALTGSTLADPSKCYLCDGTFETYCDDPVNTTLLRTCDAATNPTFGLQSPALKNSKLALKFNNLSPVSAEGGFICLKVVLSADDQKITARTCSFATLNDKDICDYLAEVNANSGVDLDCNTCDTDLCNSASSVAISLLSFVGLFILLALK